jgi:hypothetical protein
MELFLFLSSPYYKKLQAKLNILVMKSKPETSKSSSKPSAFFWTKSHHFGIYSN